MERLDRALDEGETQTAILTEFTDALEEQDAPKLKAGRERITHWDACDQMKAKDCSCPYHAEKQSPYPAAVMWIRRLR